MPALLLAFALLAAPPMVAPTSPAVESRTVAAAASTPGFRQCLDTLQRRATGAGIGVDTFERHVRPIVPDTSVLQLLDAQPEFTTPIWDYLSGLVDQQRVDDGRAMLAEHAETLAGVQARYGVDPATVVAVWGVESDFGRTFGKRPLLTSLATLSCMGRRQEFFRDELLAALHILQAGDVAAEGLVGSWAGAFGHTQFMPSTYRRMAVDHDGDGRRDLVGSIPDALASTANYLKRSGWRTGEPWGYEVKLPPGFDASASGRTIRRPLSHWVGRGVVRADGTSIAPSATPSALLLPAGRQGPAFLVFKNFDAIYSYNAAESYALAIALLADRLRGQGGLTTPWPTDDPGLSRAERRQLQELLLARGHAIGEVDGMIGSASRVAIRVEQERLGLPVDGRAGRRVLQALKAAPAVTAPPQR